MGNSITPWGATPDDWFHFDAILGLNADLLPVVSNPAGKVSDQSKMRDLGKTPSVYNRKGDVVGIPGWTQFRANGKEMAAWSVQPDYGICLQTRTVRALDIDVGDPLQAGAIAEFIAQQVGALPCRMRPNSGKCLLAFNLPGDMAKRKMSVEGGIIEFLATGQQFIAVGTHPSGVRYEWAGGLPVQIPDLTLDQFEALWSALADKFAIDAPVTGSVSMRQRAEHLDVPDPVAAFLIQSDLVLDKDRNGGLHIKCPWNDGHSTGTVGNGSTTWFKAGSNSYPKGHFCCMHSSCEGRTDAEFFEVIGFVEDVAAEFDVVAPAAGEKKPLPGFKRDKNGMIDATISNITMGVRDADFCGVQIRFDQFRDEIMWADADGDQWLPFGDADYSRLRIALEKRKFKAIGREVIRDVVLLVADENRFDSAIEWLNRQVWDGVPRVENFLRDYFGAESSEYVRSVSRYLWTAMAGRVMQPGVKADMVPVLIGEQGTGKSTGVSAMVPSMEFFTEINFNEKDEDLARKMRGRLIAEIGELRGLHTKELETIKAFITRTHENWIPKYREFAVQFPRRLVFVGTTNKTEFLADETGNRRWLPVNVRGADVARISADMLQLWAEARDLFSLLGVEYGQAENLSKGVHGDHMMVDVWEETVRKWLDTPDAMTGDIPRTRSFLQVGEALSGALNLEAKHYGRREEMRMGNVLRAFGYVRKQLRVENRRVWVYVTTVTTLDVLGSDAEIPF
jgi:hypothetical protein